MEVSINSKNFNNVDSSNVQPLLYSLSLLKEIQVSLIAENIFSREELKDIIVPSLSERVGSPKHVMLQADLI